MFNKTKTEPEEPKPITMSNPFRRPAPTPKSALGYHRVLAPTAGVRVSPLCLGTMNFGTEW